MIHNVLNTDGIRFIMSIDIGGVSFYYSDRDGEVTSEKSNVIGEVISEYKDSSENVDFSTKLYRGLVKTWSTFSNSANPSKGNASLGVMTVTIIDEDELEKTSFNQRVELESAVVWMALIDNNKRDKIIAEFKGRIETASYDNSLLKLQIKSQEVMSFKDVPEEIFDYDTFQKKIVFSDPGLDSTLIDMRFGGGLYDWGYSVNYAKSYIKRIYHSSLDGKPSGFWKGSRVDVVDAQGQGADPDSEKYCIGEFAVVIDSDKNWIEFPVVLDRYAVYRNIHKDLIDGLNDPSPPYGMTTVLNNTMCNASQYSMLKVRNGGFDDDIDWNFKGTGGSISGGTLNFNTAGSLASAYQDVNLYSSTTYRVYVDVTSYTSGQVQVGLWNNYPAYAILKAVGHYEFDIIAKDLAGTNGPGIIITADNNTTMSLDNVIVEIEKPTFQLIKNSVPENAGTTGTPIPIIYGHMEKMPAVWAISAKSTRQNSFGVGDDLYIIAGHSVKSKTACDMLAYHNLEKNAAGQRVPPGVIDFIPDPLPRSIYEIDRWFESDYRMMSPHNPEKNICPLHKKVVITSNNGLNISALKLRGDEYGGWNCNEYTRNNPGTVADGKLPGVNGEPQFPIRYGLGNSQVYVTFDGYADETAKYTGFMDALIEHPVDIIHHFIEHYGNFKSGELSIDRDSLLKSKSLLEGWKFSSAIISKVNGAAYITKLCKQCHSTWSINNSVFKLITWDLDNKSYDLTIDSETHFIGQPSYKRRSLKEIFNDFQFDYAWDYSQKKFTSSITRNKSNSGLCRDMYGRLNQFVNSLSVQKLQDIQCSFTANKAADFWVEYFASTRHSLAVKILVDDDTSTLTPGMKVRIIKRDPRAVRSIDRFFENTEQVYVVTGTKFGPGKEVLTNFISI